MIISFDLDDTLFISPRRCPAEPQSFYSRASGVYLRKGTVGLLHRLQEQGAQVWVYTTSFRSEGHIRTLFRSYGIRLDGVVNGIRHAREVQAKRAEPMPSKYPGKYRIALHVDDDVSVRQNGELYGFRVYLIHENDEEWAENILAIVERMRENGSV